MTDDNVIPFPPKMALEQPDMAGLEERLRKLRSLNESSMKTLQQHGAQLDNIIPILMRLDTLIDHVVPDGSVDRVKFEIAFEEKTKALFEDFLSQVFAAKITAGTGLVLPK